ncbi:MAG TPA: glycosyltransferase family 9 protein [Chthoniobacteraceae bacterium]|nr:glycosyltransferase family 9 protein [Chthoniobacteraceae bacterium]
MPFPSSRPFRKRANWLIALGTEAGAPLLRAYARAKTGRATPPAQWRKALIIGDNHIGDLLYRSASLAQLKAGLPQCELHYLAAPGSAQVIEGNPALAGILPWIRSDSPLDLAPEHYAALREMRFDAALCTNCIKYWPELLLAVRLGIPNRAGYDYKGFSGWVTHALPIRFPDTYPAYFRQYVAALAGRAPDWPLRPVIQPTAGDEGNAATLWERLGLSRHRRVIACFMTTRQQTGVWEPESFGATLRILRGEAAGIVLCGAAGDKPLLERIDREFDLQAGIVAGDLNLRALFCLLRRTAAVLTTDSGPRHIANAAGVPVFFFRNLRSDPTETGAYLESETDFCPNSVWLDPGQQNTILSKIAPEDVAAAIRARI